MASLPSWIYGYVCFTYFIVLRRLVASPGQNVLVPVRWIRHQPIYVIQVAERLHSLKPVYISRILHIPLVLPGDSRMLITASADQSVKLWEVETGTPYYTFSLEGPARSVTLAEGERLAAVSVDPFMGSVPAIHVLRIEAGSRQRKSRVLFTIEDRND